MKDYSTVLDSKQVDEIMDHFSNNYLGNGRDVTPEIIPGSLLDNYFFEDMSRFNFNSAKPRKHWIILEEYLNEWSSQYRLTMTDNSEKFYDTLNNYRQDYANYLRNE